MPHAILLTGSFAWGLTQIPETYRIESSDVTHYQGDRMTIDLVRALTEAAYRTPLNDPERIFVLGYFHYTHEAQNALLKLLEEPPQTARFYLITPHEHELLPTLRSRLVSLKRESAEGTSDTLDTFFSLPIAARLEEIGKRMTKKDEAWAELLMNAYEVQGKAAKNMPLQKALIDLRPLFHAPGASKKMILEHLALLV